MSQVVFSKALVLGCCCLPSTLMTCHHVLANSTLLLFADDIKLFCCIKSNSDFFQLQVDINALMEWSKLCFLSFNISKCKHLRIGPDSCSVSCALDGQTIECVDGMRDFGIIIDSLSFTQ